MGLLGCAHLGMIVLLLCGPAAGGGLVEVSLGVVQERSERGAGSPVGALH